MAWNPNEEGSYAWLTKEASSNGGVKEFLDIIESNGREQGEELGFKKAVVIFVPIVGIIGTVGIALGATGVVAYNKIKQKIEYRKALKKKSDMAKENLINTVELEESHISENNSMNTYSIT